MSISFIEHLASLRVGTIEYVSSGQINVALDLEAPNGISANAGIPRAFPCVNSYILIATELGYIVAQVEWIAVEKSLLSKRKEFQDHGLVDLPYSLLKMQVNPVGVLRKKKIDFIFSRGVRVFPSIGEPVLMPTDEQLKAIVESGEKRRVKIGTSPMNSNAEVCVDPDRLFGRHLAVLGNTGSGKSCSVAGLIQWSITAARKASTIGNKSPNARFIVLDPNGEYSKVFEHKGRVFKVHDTTKPLIVPIWLWNSAEWCSFTQASARAQVPLLKRVLRAMRNENYELKEKENAQTKQFLRTILITLKYEKSSGSPWASFPKPKSFCEKMCKWLKSLETLKGNMKSNDNRLDEIIISLKNYVKKRDRPHPSYDSDVSEISNIEEKLTSAFSSFGGIEQDLLPKSEDIPIKFTGEDFVNYFEALALDTGNEQYVAFLLARISTMLSDARMSSIIENNDDITLENWLNTYLGDNNEKSDCVTIIDLSLVPADIVHLITAVVARMVFEALQRYKKLKEKSLPTVLVMEEAHTFVKRYKEDAESMSTETVCCKMFEKISREGRKFGLGLVVSSQRPSELSPTVLSQCNSFLLHRVSNDRDQELIHRLVPDNLHGLLRELPSLPSQQAILLGWASELPIIVRINDLKECECPQSDDPDFWNVWSRSENREIDWKQIADDWQETTQENEEETEEED